MKTIQREKTMTALLTSKIQVAMCHGDGCILISGLSDNIQRHTAVFEQATHSQCYFKDEQTLCTAELNGLLTY